MIFALPHGAIHYANQEACQDGIDNLLIYFDTYKSMIINGSLLRCAVVLQVKTSSQWPRRRQDTARAGVSCVTR